MSGLCMQFHMLPQSLSIGITSRANAANEGLLAGVDAGVLLQVLAENKLLSTEGANEWFLAGVDLLMALQ